MRDSLDYLIVGRLVVGGSRLARDVQRRVEVDDAEEGQAGEEDGREDEAEAEEALAAEVDDLVAEDVQVPGDRLERLQQLLEEHESGKEQVGPEAEQVVVVEEEDRNEEGEQRHQAAEHQDQVDDCPSMPKSAKFQFS